MTFGLLCFQLLKEMILSRYRPWTPNGPACNIISEDLWDFEKKYLRSLFRQWLDTARCTDESSPSLLHFCEDLEKAEAGISYQVYDTTYRFSITEIKSGCTSYSQVNMKSDTEYASVSPWRVLSSVTHCTCLAQLRHCSNIARN